MLLTLEGLDGSGKTSCVGALRASSVVPKSVVYTCEPTDSWYGEAVGSQV